MLTTKTQREARRPRDRNPAGASPSMTDRHYISGVPGIDVVLDLAEAAMDGRLATNVVAV